MVHVYVARIPGEKLSHTVQSAWAYRLLEISLKREYRKIRTPVCVEKDAMGKPYLPEQPGIYISISHSGNIAACAIGERPVGVDVEVQKGRKDPERVVKKFHPLEQEAYAKAVSHAKEDMDGKLWASEFFYHLWVLKESFLKAEGSGMRIPLDSFCVLESAGTDGDGDAFLVPGKVRKVEQSLNNQLYYCMLYPDCGDGISLAVCSEEKEMEEQAVWLTLPEEF